MREVKKRQIFQIAAIVIAAVSLLVGSFFTLSKGVYVGDKFFYKRTSKNDKNYEKYVWNKSNYIEQISENEYKIVSDFGEKTVWINFESDIVSFNFSDGSLFSGIWNGEDLMEENGLLFGWDDVQILTNHEIMEVSDKTYCRVLCKIYFNQEERISVWYIPVIGIIIYIMGIFAFLYPNESYFFFRKWKYDTMELSEDGKILEKIGGLITSILGIALMSGVIFLFLH